jgi:signal transduction histidine kinase
MSISLSLRTKGVFAVTILIGYLALIGIFLARERQGLVEIVQDMESTQAKAGLLEPTVNALARSLVEHQKSLNTQDALQFRPPIPSDVGLHLAPLSAALEEVRRQFPATRGDVVRFRHAAAAVTAMPASQHLAQLRDAEQVLLETLQSSLDGLRVRRDQLVTSYRRKQQFISAFAIGANILGAVASVAVILVFFTRLAGDLDRLKVRAGAIVAGYDGPPLRTTRGDEVGSLIQAVNHMQQDLRRSEQQMELARQQRFHQEKMAAVGSLASAISHEVNNPIAAIAGVAQFIVDESRGDERPQGRRIFEFGSMILGQTERIANIMRHMATLTQPRSPEPELFDLNVLIRSTCTFVRYDKRFGGIELEEALDHDLPAVTAVADHLTQILMNLLINAADATDHITAEGGRRIRVATALVGDVVHMTVTDNGKGMTPEVLAKAFEESFTTKPAGHGRGIGLFVCKGLIERAGGCIVLESVPYQGTTATVQIPLKPPAKAAR